jgi:hypothetical protein
VLLEEQHEVPLDEWVEVVNNRDVAAPILPHAEEVQMFDVAPTHT